MSRSHYGTVTTGRGNEELVALTIKLGVAWKLRSH